MRLKNPKILKKLNDLLIMNHEIETTYLEGLEYVYRDDLKTYFRERSFERYEFGKLLQSEIQKLNKNSEYSKNNFINFSKIKMNIKNALLFQYEVDLLREIREIKYLTINVYNDLLLEHGLPLSLCKLLIRQRDQIQDNLTLLEREKSLVA